MKSEIARPTGTWVSVAVFIFSTRMVDSKFVYQRGWLKQKKKLPLHSKVLKWCQHFRWYWMHGSRWKGNETVAIFRSRLRSSDRYCRNIENLKFKQYTLHNRVFCVLQAVDSYFSVCLRADIFYFLRFLRPDRKAGLDSGLDFGLDSGLDFGLTFIDLKWT